MKRPRKSKTEQLFATCIRSEIIENERGKSLRLTLTADGADRDAYVYASLADTDEAKARFRALASSFGIPTTSRQVLASDFVHRTLPLTQPFDKSFKYYSTTHEATAQAMAADAVYTNERIDAAIDLLRQAAKIIKELKRNATS